MGTHGDLLCVVHFSKCWTGALLFQPGLAVSTRSFVSNLFCQLQDIKFFCRSKGGELAKKSHFSVASLSEKGSSHTPPCHLVKPV